MFRDEGRSCGLGREKLRGLGRRSTEGARLECKLSLSVSLTGLRRPKGMVRGSWAPWWMRWKTVVGDGGVECEIRLYPASRKQQYPWSALRIARSLWQGNGAGDATLATTSSRRRWVINGGDMVAANPVVTDSSRRAVPRRTAVQCDQHSARSRTAHRDARPCSTPLFMC